MCTDDTVTEVDRAIGERDWAASTVANDRPLCNNACLRAADVAPAKNAVQAVLMCATSPA
jgi:hypothetical protein